MINEVKLFTLTRHLMAMFAHDRIQVMESLKRLLHRADLPEAYWDAWMDRYEKLSESRAVQVVLLRQAGYSYRKIQATLRIAPSTIQKILENYELNYGELEGTNLLAQPLLHLERRLKKVGTELW